MVRLMEKQPRNTKQIRAARDFLHCVILEQRAATEELKASNRELESLLDDLISSRADLKSVATDEGEGMLPRRRREAEPAEQSLSRLRREIESVLDEGAAAVHESVRLRRRARRLREALHAGRPAAEPPTGASLSRREHQVLTLIVQG